MPTAVLPAPLIEEVFDLDLRVEFDAVKPKQPKACGGWSDWSLHCDTSADSTCMRTCTGLTGRPCAC